MLRVEKLVVSYEGLRALQGVSLSVNEGEFVSILGPNGAGKSTLLKTIAGLMVPDEGSVTFLGKRLDGRPTHEAIAHGVALVPEGGMLFPQMSVEENLLMGAYVVRGQPVIKERLADVYRIFPRLSERRKQDAGSLSGGERQMLAVGRSLMSGPRVLMLDEPSVGLAPIIVDEIFRVLRQIHHKGVTVILAEQHVHQALEVSSRAYVLEQGRIVMSGDSATVRDDPGVKARYLGA